MRSGDSSKSRACIREWQGARTRRLTRGCPPVEPANVLTTQTKPWPRAVASVVTSTRAGVHAAGQRQGNCVAGVGQKKPARQAGEESAGGDGVPVTDAVGDATMIGETRSARKTKIIIIILTDATFSLVSQQVLLCNKLHNGRISIRNQLAVPSPASSAGSPSPAGTRTPRQLERQLARRQRLARPKIPQMIRVKRHWRRAGPR